MADKSNVVEEIDAPATDAEWLDEMILVGRMYVGGTRNEHGRLCQVIQADREVHHLLERLQGVQEESACR